MIRAIERIAKQPYVAYVDDARAEGNGIIVRLHDAYEFVAEPGRGMRGFDTVGEATRGCSRDAIKVRGEA